MDQERGSIIASDIPPKSGSHLSLILQIEAVEGLRSLIQVVLEADDNHMNALMMVDLLFSPTNTTSFII